ncbi:MAG: hypothetical protein HWQ40_15370 [Nostoc sp. NMS9]|nr:hypothetical protein [Nostoc sp. NMS9]
MVSDRLKRFKIINDLNFDVFHTELFGRCKVTQLQKISWVKAAKYRFQEPGDL